MKQFFKKDHFKSFKRKAVDENENEMGDTIEEINKKSGVADSLYQGDILLTRLTKRSRLPSEKQRSYGQTTRALISKNTIGPNIVLRISLTWKMEKDAFRKLVGKKKKVRNLSDSAKAVD
ncbi:hypothetical protein OSTOST_11123, partial [Ostertagia ostertagi]